MEDPTVPKLGIGILSMCPANYFMIYWIIDELIASQMMESNYSEISES